ncbi:21687_t:CDS:2, partial [Rhizophagus irregularis]
SGIDLRLFTPNSGFMNLPKHLRRLMSNWFIITKDNIDINDDASEVMVLKVYSPDERISNILLKKRIFRRNVVISPLLNIHAELKLAYEDLGDDSVILDITPSFFEFASFIFENERDNTILRRLHIGDVELNRTRLGCPMYRLQTTHTNQQRVFSISLVNAINVVHFVHCCKDEECIEGDHDSKQFHFIHDLEHVQLDLE